MALTLPDKNELLRDYFLSTSMTFYTLAELTLWLSRKCSVQFRAFLYWTESVQT